MAQYKMEPAGSNAVSTALPNFKPLSVAGPARCSVQGLDYAASTRTLWMANGDVNVRACA